MSGRRTYASSPCLAAEVDPAYFDLLGVDPGQARDVARWRRAERVRLARLTDDLGQAGRAQAREMTWTASAEQMTAIYRELLEAA